MSISDRIAFQKLMKPNDLYRMRRIIKNSTKLYEEYGLATLSKQWLKLIDKYQTEMSDKLDEIGNKTKEAINKSIIDLIATLKFGVVKDVLNEYKGSLTNK